jgi:hypothetical protein
LKLEQTADPVTSAEQTVDPMTAWTFDLQLFADDDKPADKPEEKPDDKSQDKHDGRSGEVDTVSKGYAETLRKDAENERKLRQAAEKERDELAKFKSERERKDLEDKEEHKKLADFEKEARVKAEQDRDEKVAAANREKVLAKAEAIAIRLGIKDEALDDLVLRPELKDAEIADLPEIIAKIKETKGFWFDDGEKPADKKPEDKRVVTTPARKTTETSTDWAKADPKDFRAKMAEMGVRV